MRALFARAAVARTPTATVAGNDTAASAATLTYSIMQETSQQ